MIWSLLLGSALAAAPGAPTLGQWTVRFGSPSRDPELAERTRSPDEPLLVYWLSAQADPLGLGPALPGTLVANFRATDPTADSPVQSFTFLGGGTAEQLQELVSALEQSGCVAEDRLVDREGGTFRELLLACPDGRTGTVALRQGDASGQLADGRPSPALWMHVTLP